MRIAGFTSPVQALAVGLCLVTTLAGCSNTPMRERADQTTAQCPSNWPDQLVDFRFRWTSESDFDLTNG